MAFHPPSSRQEIRKVQRFGAAMLTFFIATLLLAACSTTNSDLPTPDENPPVVETPQWESVDIGESNLGRTEYDSGEFKLQGIGDIAYEADAFHFTYRAASGNVGIAARLADHSATLPDSWAKAGLTVRGGLEPDAANVTIYATSNSQFTGLVVQARSAAGQSTRVLRSISQSAADAPQWLRLLRNGSEVLVDVSADGETWNTIVSGVEIEFTGKAYLGLAVASGEASTPIEATFRDVKLVDGRGQAPVEPPPGPSPDPEPEPDPAPDPTPDPNPGPKASTTYQIDSRTDFLNPERGFHPEVNLIAGTGFDNVRGRGYTVVRSYVRLDDYRNSRIPTRLLNDLRNGFERARAAGVKVVLRFSYNFGNAQDAPLNRVLEHIEQLEPVLRENSDVIAVLQAGFIGAWGEWHGSTNGLTSAANKRTIGEALLAAMPDSRMVQVRAPFHRRDIVGSPSPSVDIFGSSGQARLGFKNDCFLSTDSDSGTYGGDQVRDRREAAETARYTVTGGETCAIGFPSPRQDCVVALDELAEFSWDYLNAGFHSGVLNRWRDQGCYDEISRRLGYRLGLVSGAVTESASPGDSITVDLRMRNDGFGKVYNPRPIDIVLRNTSTGATRALRAVADARRILPLAGETRDLQLSVRLPSDLPTGDYEVLLALPDFDSSLAGDVRYNIRLANVGTWESSTGLNALGLTTRVGN